MISLSDLKKAIENIAPYNRNSKAPYDIDGQVCKRCETYKSTADFGRGSNYKAGFNTRCKKCIMEIKYEGRAKRRKAANPVDNDLIP